MKKILLSVAGFDPTSGAGLTLDQNVFLSMGFHGVGILTAVTVQNTKEVKKIHCHSPDFLWKQYLCLCQDLTLSGIKVGMVGSRKNIPLIFKILSEHSDIPRVVDPVLKSSSGYWLLEKKAIFEYIAEISGQASLLTPNLEEAQLLSGIKIKHIEEMKKAAEKIFSLSKIPCFIKGGHFKDEALDLLFDGDDFHTYRKENLKKTVHGTGCYLSSSLLGYLVKGNSLEKACLFATRLIQDAIKKAIPIGHGQHIISFHFSSQLHSL